jgi:hypothetical protein
MARSADPPESVSDEVAYADIDLHGRYGADGRYLFTRRDGSGV